MDQFNEEGQDHLDYKDPADAMKVVLKEGGFRTRGMSANADTTTVGDAIAEALSSASLLFQIRQADYIVFIRRSVVFAPPRRIS